MIDFLDSAAARGSAYLVLAALAVVLMAREHRCGEQPNLWPRFWLVSALSLTTMGIGQATELGDWLTGLGRDQAHDAGWYDGRRPYQVAVVAIVFGGWLISVLLSIVLVPPRRRRYLPSAIAQMSLLCYAAIRSVSLHQIDAALYRRDVGGLIIASLAEWVLLGLNLIAIAIRFHIEPSPDRIEVESRPSAPPDDATPTGVTRDPTRAASR